MHECIHTKTPEPYALNLGQQTYVLHAHKKLSASPYSTYREKSVLIAVLHILRKGVSTAVLHIPEKKVSQLQCSTYRKKSVLIAVLHILRKGVSTAVLHIPEKKCLNCRKENHEIDGSKHKHNMRHPLMRNVEV
jgi:hypothetical protein